MVPFFSPILFEPVGYAAFSNFETNQKGPWFVFGVYVVLRASVYRVTDQVTRQRRARLVYFLTFAISASHLEAFLSPGPVMP